MMPYSDKKISEFIKELSSSAPTPGGGSASAIVGATAAALIVMDCNLTIGKEAYAGVQRRAMDIRRKCERMSAALLRLADRDARSFEAVMKAFSLPRETELQKLKRFERIQSTLKKATVVPLEVMNIYAELQELAGFMVEFGNRNSRSDAIVGFIMADAALKGAYENLEINLESIKDERFVREINRSVSELLKTPPQYVR